MKLIAFYLPQYHIIPENEQVYGKGFTEWNNVKNATPLFENHYQPHIPHKTIGYYSLVDEKFITLQHSIAYNAGVNAFCYYYYKFGEKNLLDEPLKIINESDIIKNNFCLCWAHFSWYNNKIGKESTFIEQIYNKTNAIKLAQDLKQYFCNPRYITIDGKPLLLIWAPERHPEMRLYAEILRQAAVGMGFSGICLAGVEAYKGMDPQACGLDCMVEFAPNWRVENHVSPPGELPRRIDYAATMKYMLNKSIPDYTRMRCIFPGWDNTPRRGLDGIACVGQHPDMFRLALEYLIDYTKEVLPSNMQYIFINAWNEWGEGCHIEPDKKFGFKYLQIIDAIMKNHAAAT